jgi:glycosyltransferase involved in cell wall biosynthesis
MTGTFESSETGSAPRAATAVELITVIAPLRDEADNVDGFVVDLAAQDFDGDVEVLVADGGSTDGSPERLARAAEAAGLSLRVLPNPERIVSTGLNRCIGAARGELIVRMDCHSRYPSDYLRHCATAAEATGAWNVGGVLEPTGVTRTERAVACAMDSPYGGIGWTSAASRPVRSEVDTLTFGAFPPHVFTKVGLFDERFVRNQDDELNVRIRRAGGRVVLDPSIRVLYRPRGSLRGVWRQYYDYGRWKVPVMRKHRQVLSPRSLAPLVFVVATVLLALAAPFSEAARWLLAAELGVYVLSALVFGAAAIRRRGESARLVPLVVAAYPVFHVAYGAGMAVALVRPAR